MQLFRTLTFIVILFSAHRALGLTCRDFSDHAEVTISDMEDTKVGADCPTGVAPFMRKPLTFFFTSYGGNIDHINHIVNEMKTVMTKAQRESGFAPVVVITEACMSACIPILAGFNQMAKEKIITLVIDSKTSIGFHGCSDVYDEEPKLRFTVEGTNRYLKYLAMNGGSTEWISRHMDLFASPRIREFSPTAPDLQDSGIFEYAEIRDVPPQGSALQANLARN
jgi:hypothetical protein